MITILHAFSRRNSGDGLLVDLTYEVLADAGFAPDQCRIVALDPDSFPDLANVVRAPGEHRSVPSPRLLDAALQVALSYAGADRIAKLVKGSTGIVAVGGGYLVADSPVRQAGVVLNHLAQINAAGSSGAPTVYLPQSIGPLQGPVDPLLRKALSRIDRIWVRDNRTLAELGSSNVARCPDLAVLKLARALREPTSVPGGPIVLVGRDLPASGNYDANLLRVEQLSDDTRWAVQADVDGPRSDRAYYRKLGVSDHGPLDTVLAQGAGAVVSVRLHGAIGALLAGVPAVHLSYERKGWGAYEDLGLDEWVHDARNFDPQLVARQARELAADPSRMWQKLEAARVTLRTSYETLVTDLASRFSR
ncbi:MAG: polysaccharide pyruvyl transferase family protein [Novosphingobium sp.]